MTHLYVWSKKIAARIMVFVFIFAAIASIASPHAWAASTTIDFEALPNGTATTDGMLLTTQYESWGVSFPDGVEVVRCYAGSPFCQGASSGEKVVRSLLVDEFNRKPLNLRFSSLQNTVSLRFRAEQRATPPIALQATLTAYDERNLPIATTTQTFSSDGSYYMLRVAVPGAATSIARAVLESRESSSTLAGRNFLFVDDLVFEGIQLPPPADTQAPQVDILRPVPGTMVAQTAVDVAIRVQDDRALQTVSFGVTHSSGREVLPLSEGNICGSAAWGICTGNSLERTFSTELLRSLEGPYTIRVRACDPAGNCSEASTTVILDLPVLEKTDLWVMGIEYNQGIQDIISTDLNRAPGLAGFVPIRCNPNCPDSELATPIIPSKPMVVRVYVGLRARPDLPAAPSEGISVTGRLLVSLPVTGGGSWSLPPIQTDACAEQSGTTSGQSCRQVIHIFPSFGRQGLGTNTDYDLDLVNQRSHWEGTLNFVVPPDVTQRAAEAGGLDFRTIVEPVARAEAELGDNEFRLQLGNVAPPNPLSIRLVRVRMPTVFGEPPSSAAAARALVDMLRLTPFDRLNIVSDKEFFYDGSEISVSVGGGSVIRFSQCQMLWYRLYQEFPLHPSQTLVALTPANIDLHNCGNGLGWKVPDPDSLVTTSVTYLGGIALARMPAYSGDRAADMRRITTLTQELYHAHLDRRHVSNDHGEAGGCPIKDGPLKELIDFLTPIDPDCWKVAIQPHGAIGSYSAATVEIWRRGESTGRIFGNAGAVGVSIEPDGTSWRLTLFDPCPTGPLSRTDPLTTFGQRWDVTKGGYNCAVDHNLVPHDFMSYGPNRWIGKQSLPVLKGFGAVSIPDLNAATQPRARAAAVDHPALNATASNATILTSVSALQVSGMIDLAGVAGFAPLFPASATGRRDALTAAANNPLLLDVEDTAGQTTAIPLAFAVAPPHPKSFVFFGTTLPPGLAPRRLTLKLNGRELASLTASPNAPTVRILAPSPGKDQPGHGMVTVGWDSSDADGDKLSFAIQFSADSGLTWQPLGAVGDQASLNLPKSALNCNQQGRIRVVVSDGLNIATDEADSALWCRIETRLYLPLVRR
jgi:hypothetical protein